MDVKIEPQWKERLGMEFRKPYFKELTDFVREQYQTTTVYPPPLFIFNAFNSCPFDQVRVVLLGQDPYHGAGQAHGLCFSVPAGVRPPPSLQNIFRELHSDLGIAVPSSGTLQPWTQQGVFLLNATLTVRAGQPGSHQHHGWETFTDAAISVLSQQREHLVFILWGAYAQQKTELIDKNKHLVLTAPHPSPYSADRGFFGCHHFSKTNDYLQRHDMTPIDWRLT